MRVLAATNHFIYFGIIAKFEKISLDYLLLSDKYFSIILRTMNVLNLNQEITKNMIYNAFDNLLRFVAQFERADQNTLITSVTCSMKAFYFHLSYLNLWNIFFLIRLLQESIIKSIFRKLFFDKNY